MRVLDLFSGIGGFSLGLERAGMTTAMFCEIEPFCRRVLAKHWPGVPIHDDVRTMGAELLARHGVAVDLVCGGFPCQNISVAGKGEGLSGDRSRLWFEYLRVIEETRPRWVVIENVPALRSRGLDIVLGGLAALRYDAEWHCVPAAAVGAPHRRDRVWIVANANAGQRQQQDEGLCAGRDAAGVGVEDVAYTEHGGLGRRDANGPVVGTGAIVPSGWWGVEPDVGRVAHGVPSRVHRLRSLGNAVVPQIPELIGRAIMAAEAAEAAEAAK